MKQACFCFILLILGICCVTANAQDSGVDIVQNQGVVTVKNQGVVTVKNQGVVSSEILQAVQKKVESLKEQNINLIAEEEITIEEFDDKGEINKTTDILSEYRIIPNNLGKSFAYGIPHEERTVLSAKENGKIKKMKKIDDPFITSGNAFTDLYVVFDTQNEEYFDYSFFGNMSLGPDEKSNLPDENNKKNFSGDYKIKIRDALKGRNLYMINIIQKEADVGKTNNERWNLKYRGLALIDLDTMEIVQVNRGKTYRVLSVGFIVRVAVSRKYFYTQYEYDSIKIGDRFLTLPTAKTVELYKMNGQLDAVYKYKYSNYREFTVDTKIKYGAID